MHIVNQNSLFSFKNLFSESNGRNGKILVRGEKKKIADYTQEITKKRVELGLKELKGRTLPKIRNDWAKNWRGSSLSIGITLIIGAVLTAMVALIVLPFIPVIAPTLSCASIVMGFAAICGSPLLGMIPASVGLIVDSVYYRSEIKKCKNVLKNREVSTNEAFDLIKRIHDQHKNYKHPSKDLHKEYLQQMYKALEYLGQYDLQGKVQNRRNALLAHFIAELAKNDFLKLNLLDRIEQTQQKLSIKEHLSLINSIHNEYKNYKHPSKDLYQEYLHQMLASLYFLEEHGGELSQAAQDQLNKYITHFQLLLHHSELDGSKRIELDFFKRMTKIEGKLLSAKAGLSLVRKLDAQNQHHPFKSKDAYHEFLRQMYDSLLFLDENSKDFNQNEKDFLSRRLVYYTGELAKNNLLGLDLSKRLTKEEGQGLIDLFMENPDTAFEVEIFFQILVNIPFLDKKTYRISEDAFKKLNEESQKKIIRSISFILVNGEGKAEISFWENYLNNHIDPYCTSDSEIKERIPVIIKKSQIHNKRR